MRGSTTIIRPIMAAPINIAELQRQRIGNRTGSVGTLLFSPAGDVKPAGNTPRAGCEECGTSRGAQEKNFSVAHWFPGSMKNF